MVNLYSKLRNFKGVFLLINNNHQKEIDFLHLLRKQNINCLAIYRQKPSYFYDGKKIYLNNFIFFFLILISFFFKNHKILITSQPYFAIPYIFFSKNINLYAYDTHIGLDYISNSRKFIERIVINFFKNIIHRDLRLWSYYKKILKKPNRKNLFLPDHIRNFAKTEFKKKNFPIKCAFIGWADNKSVKVHKSVKKFLELGIDVYFFSTQNTFDLTKNLMNLNDQEEKLLHFEGQIFGKEFQNKLKDFHFGICPHDSEKPYISKRYRKYCSSHKIFDYLNNSMTVILSESVHYQKYIIKCHNGSYIHSKDFYKTTNKEELSLKQNNKEIFLKSKYFKHQFLAYKLKKFLEY